MNINLNIKNFLKKRLTGLVDELKRGEEHPTASPTPKHPSKEDIHDPKDVKDSKEKEKDKEKEKEKEKEEHTNAGGPQKKSEWTEEKLKPIESFVNMVTQLGVEGLRKQYRDHLAHYKAENYHYTSFEANPTKNRYQDVVCLEDTRVKLQESTNDYIHANYVKFANHDRVFIATQAPLENTIEDFWKMVYYEGCLTILNLTKNIEDGKVKCSQYWPIETGAYVNFGTMFINTKKVEEEDKFIVYTIEVLPEGCSNSNIVRMIHFQSWPDRGVPMSGLSVLRLLRLVNNSDKNQTGGPVAIHCSAGIGRTGTIIMIDVLLHRLFKTPQPVDLIDLFQQLRNQRASCIQVEGQYIFVLSSLLDYIKARIPNKFRKECDKFREDFMQTQLDTK